jgi:hypothetical protein
MCIWVAFTNRSPLSSYPQSPSKVDKIVILANLREDFLLRAHKLVVRLKPILKVG